jgi:hypothetical protein
MFLVNRRRLAARLVSFKKNCFDSNTPEDAKPFSSDNKVLRAEVWQTGMDQLNSVNCAVPALQQH